MAWLPISYTVPQYLDTSVSPPTPASGFVLKAYQVGTTTNIPFATDNSGSPTANSIALNAQGYPEVSGNVVIPHMDQDYKLALYPDQASADADSGAIWTVDDIDLHQTGTEEAAAQEINVWPLVDYGGAYFDGTNDYLTRGAGLTGAANGKKGTIVAFVSFDASATAIEYILHATGGTILLRRDADGVFRIIAENSAGTTILNIATSSSYEELNTVYCIMASWDLASAGPAQIYVNDASDVAETTFTNDTIDYTVADWAVGADVSGSNKITGNIFSVWFDPTDNLDFDTELNRRRFLDEVDNPVYTGVQGELVTGTQPILFLGNHDETTFETNRGSGGDFTENGTLAAATVDFDGQYAHGNRDATDDEVDDVANVITTEGDLMAGDASGDESRLAIGAANTILRSGGTTFSWGPEAGVDTVITSGSGNYTVPANITEIIVTIVGGGAGGAGGGNNNGGGGGGGSGAEWLCRRLTVTPESTIAYSVGSGGAGGGGGGISGGTGFAGGSTTFGSLTADGGNTGTGGQSGGTGAAGGTGGTAPSPDGGNGVGGGGPGGTSNPTGHTGSGGDAGDGGEGGGGGGGSTPLGQGGDGATFSSGRNAADDAGPGGGGGGGSGGPNTGDTSGGDGGNGGDGLIIVQLVRP